MTDQTETAGHPTPEPPTIAAVREALDTPDGHAVIAHAAEVRAEVERLRAYAETTRHHHHQQQHAEAYRELVETRERLGEIAAERNEFSLKLDGVTADLNEIRTERDQLKARIDAALERHSRDTDGSCKGCGLDAYEEPIPWPCSTVRALQGDQPAETSVTDVDVFSHDGTFLYVGTLQRCPDGRLATFHPSDERVTSPQASPSTVDSGEAVAKLTDPNGCRHCGAPERGHYRRYADGVGWHKWTAPDDAVRLERMRARREASQPPAPFVPAADAFPEEQP